MKRLVAIVLIALLAGGAIGALVARDPGYVLVAYDDISVETSLWFGLLLLLIIYAAARLVVFLVTRFLHGGADLSEWNRGRRERSALKQTVRGLLLEGEGRWADARKTLLASARNSPLPLVNYLHAARAAQAQGDYDGRDALLDRALAATPDAKVPLSLVRTELQLDAGQADQALATLLELHRDAPRNSRVLRGLQRCYGLLGDWQALLELVPDLERTKAVAEADLDAVIRTACVARLRQVVAASDPDLLEATWALVPKALHDAPDVAAASAAAHAAHGRAKDAEHLLRHALRKTWSDELVTAYGELDADAVAQLKHVEDWLKDHPRDPVLLLAAGRIASRGGAADAAREYLEASLHSRPSPEAYVALAWVRLAQGDADAAGECLARAVADGTAAWDPARDQRRAAQPDRGA